MKTGLLRIRQEYIGPIASFVTMGGEFTLINKRAGTGCGTVLTPHIPKPLRQQDNLEGVSEVIVNGVSQAKSE